MTKNQHKYIKNELQDVGLSNFSILYILDSIKICEKSHMHILDINLNKKIYPILEKKYKKSYRTIEKSLVDDLKNSWSAKKNRNKLKHLLNYKNKPTFKKIIILLLILIRHN